MFILSNYLFVCLSRYLQLFVSILTFFRATTTFSFPISISFFQSSRVLNPESNAIPDTFVKASETEHTAWRHVVPLPLNILSFVVYGRCVSAFRCFLPTLNCLSPKLTREVHPPLPSISTYLLLLFDIFGAKKISPRICDDSSSFNRMPFLFFFFLQLNASNSIFFG